MGPNAKWFFVIAWGIAIVGGLTILALYDAKPGSPGGLASANVSFPGASKTTGVAQLLMFVHPKCPCSAASAEELARLMTECRGRLDARVFVYQPLDQPDSWSQTVLVNTLRSIPGVSIQLDRDACMARQMGISTSGQVLYFGRSGKLRFNGGITASRGHAGDNDGVDTILADFRLGDSAFAGVKEAPVFGCGLYSCPVAARETK